MGNRCTLDDATSKQSRLALTQAILIDRPISDVILIRSSLTWSYRRSNQHEGGAFYPSTDKGDLSPLKRGYLPPKRPVADVDGERGLLIYRGPTMSTIWRRRTRLRKSAYLLLCSDLPTPFQLDEFRTALLRQMNLPEPVDEFLRRLPWDSFPRWPPLEAAVAFASLYDTEGDGLAGGAPQVGSTRCPRADDEVRQLVASAKGESPVPPNTGLSLAANFLWMLTGRLPSFDEDHAERT